MKLTLAELKAGVAKKLGYTPDWSSINKDVWNEAIQQVSTKKKTNGLDEHTIEKLEEK